MTALAADPRTIEHLGRVVGVEILDADFLTLPSDAFAPFDAVTFKKVLEHIEDPAPMLERTVLFLTPRGFVYLEVPDVEAAAAGHGREEFFIEHHHVFSPASLAMLAERAGLDLIALHQLREPSTKFTLAAFAGQRGA